MTNCKNCNINFNGNFCSNCGQAANTNEINFKSILHEIEHGLLHIDKGMLYTTKELFHRPGHTIREYLEGKRIKHFKPIAYVLILSTIYVLLTKFSHKTTLIEKVFVVIANGQAEKSGGKLNFLIVFLDWMKNHYSYTTLIILPIISLASYLSFFKTKYNYFQHLILNSFIAGQRTVVFLLIFPFIYFIQDKEIINTINQFKIILGVVLNFWAYYQFFSSTKPLKKILLTILSHIVIVIIVFILISILTVVSNTIN
jgi:Protein of unknown function (DUF3667)